MSAASMTPMLVGRFSSLDRFISAFEGEIGSGVLPVRDLIDLVGDAGGLGRTARTVLTQLSREGKRRPPGGEGGSPVAGFVCAPEMTGRGGDDTTECGFAIKFMDILLRRGGRGGTGGTGGMDDGTAGSGPVGGGRGSGGGVSERDIARLRCRGEKAKGGDGCRFDGEATPDATAKMRVFGGVRGTDGEGSDSDGFIDGNVGDEPRATGEVGDDVEHMEVGDSSEGACGATPTAGRNARISILGFRDGTTTDRCCGRPLCSSGTAAEGNVAREPNVEARGVGSSSKFSGSVVVTEGGVSVPSKDVLP